MRGLLGLVAASLLAVTGVTGAAIATAPQAAVVAAAPAPPPTGANLTTVGVNPATKLKPSGSLRVTTDGTVIAARDIRGEVYVDADNVTIRNSKVTGAGWSIIRVAEGSKGVRIVHVEVDGLSYNGSPGSAGIFGPATVTASEIVGVENGVIPFTGSILRNNYIHTLRSPGDDPHYDGIQTDGYQHDITITRNTVDVTDVDQTSAVMINNDFGPVDNITVTRNHLGGGSFTVYSDGKFRAEPIRGVSFIENRLGSGYYGYGLIRNSEGTVWRGNFDATTGKPVTP